MSEQPKSFRPWSYSRMGVARSCPYRFKRQYIDGVEQPTDPPRRVGQAAHEVVARYGLHCARNKRQTDYEAMQTILTGCRNMTVGADEAEAVREMCTRFAESRLIGDNWRYEGRVAVNTDWQTCDYDSPECFFRGRVDCWYIDGEDNLVIVDYYSGWLRPNEQLKMDQLKNYAMMLFQIHPDIDVAVCFADFLRFFNDASKEFTVSRDEVEYKKAEIISLDSRYAQEREFLPTPNEGCGYCHLRRECPAIIDAMKNLPAAATDARTLWLLKCAAKEITERLEAGPVSSWEVGDMILGHHQSSTESYDFEKTVDILARKLKIDPTATRPLLAAVYGGVDHLSASAMKSVIKTANASKELPKSLTLADFKEAHKFKSKTTFTFKSGDKASPLPNF